MSKIEFYYNFLIVAYYIEKLYEKVKILTLPHSEAERKIIMESYVEQWKREKREREEAEKKAAAQKESQKEEVKNGKNKRSCGLEAEETGSGGEQTVRQQPDNKTD